MAHLSISDWTALCAAAQTVGDTRSVFHTIAHSYDQETRFYHTQQHIAHCLREFAEARSCADDPVALEFAIWLHDVIYDPKASDNEAKSAAFAEEQLALLQTAPNLIRRVSNLILATQLDSSASSRDEEIMIDADLAILGADILRFDEYEAQIRMEYSWVPERAFVSARREILSRFLNRPFLYHTDHFRKKYEKQAKENLKHSLAKLN